VRNWACSATVRLAQNTVWTMSHKMRTVGELVSQLTDTSPRLSETTHWCVQYRHPPQRRVPSGAWRSPAPLRTLAPAWRANRGCAFRRTPLGGQHTASIPPLSASVS
jgi:hypothetical protein